MRALVAYEGGICKCGFHQSLTADKSNFFQVEDRRCPVCASSEQYARLQHASDEQAKKALGDNPNPTAPLPSDGRLTYMRRLSPEEVERRRAERAIGRGGGSHRNQA